MTKGTEETAVGGVQKMSMIGGGHPTCAAATDPLAEVLRLEAVGQSMNGKGHSDADWDAWNEELDAAYDRVLRMPSIPANAQLKARAIVALCSGNADELFTHSQKPGPLSEQLALQVINSLAGGLS